MNWMAYWPIELKKGVEVILFRIVKKRYQHVATREGKETRSAASKNWSIMRF